jgi:hypothetical protein
MREASKLGGEARIATVLPQELVAPVLAAYHELTTTQQGASALPVDHGFNDLARRLKAAATSGSKLEQGARFSRPGAACAS